MPKVSVYLPDDLYRTAREQELPISALAQRAIEAELRARSTDSWILAVRARPRRFAQPIDTAALLDEVREEFGS